MMDTLLHWFGQLDYLSIGVLMAMESSIIPVPSELVMIPAGYLSATGNLNPLFAALVGSIGSVIGALANYYIIGRWIGKPFLEQYGKYILITREKYQRAESLFLKNNKLYTFLGRLLPVIRHLISIPAGIFRMPLRWFISITFLGSLLWCSFLVMVGYFFGESAISIVRNYSHEVGIIAVIGVMIWVYMKVWRK